MADKLDEKKMAADGHSSIENPVTPQGGEAKHSSTGADLKKKVHPKADSVDDKVTKVTHNPEKVVEEKDEDEDEEMEESFDLSSLFEGLDLSEGFKDKVSLVFEAAVEEAATAKASKLAEEIEANLQEQLETSLSESLEEIVENLDGYLDYVVSEWMKENEVAIESGIKVEMAESLIEGMKELFYEHNISISEDTVDVVAELEEELTKARNTANEAINNAIQMEEEVSKLQAEKVFNSVTNGLSEAQIERLRTLSERLDISDLSDYSNGLSTLKESFFKPKTDKIIREDLDVAGGEIVIETTTSVKNSPYDSVNKLAQALNSIK